MNRTHKLACIAMLTALSIVANLFTIPLSGSNSMSFTIAICFFTGIYFGPLPAAIVGFMGDLIAHFIPIGFSSGPYNWFIAIATTLFGVVAGLVYKLKLPKLANLGISSIICYIVCLCGLNTFGLWLYYIAGVSPSPWGLVKFFSMDQSGIQKSFWVYLAGRAPWSLINILVNTVIVAGLQHSKTIAKLMTNMRRKNKVEQTEATQEEQAQQNKADDNTLN